MALHGGAHRPRRCLLFKLVLDIMWHIQNWSVEKLDIPLVTFDILDIPLENDT